MCVLKLVGREVCEHRMKENTKCRSCKESTSNLFMSADISGLFLTVSTFSRLFWLFFFFCNPHATPLADSYSHKKFMAHLQQACACVRACVHVSHCVVTSQDVWCRNAAPPDSPDDLSHSFAHSTAGKSHTVSLAPALVWFFFFLVAVVVVLFCFSFGADVWSDGLVLEIFQWNLRWDEPKTSTVISNKCPG